MLLGLEAMPAVKQAPFTPATREYTSFSLSLSPVNAVPE